MKLTIDDAVGALHLQLVDVPVEESEEVAPGVIVDFDGLHQVVGIELLHLSKNGWPVNLLDFQFQLTLSNKGFTELKRSNYAAVEGETVLDFRISPPDKSNMAKYLFGGFQRCLYPVQKFQSEMERKLAIILDREALKWFKPAKGQF